VTANREPGAALGHGQPEVDFTAVAQLLDAAAVLVRTRAERGEPPARDHRPRIPDAITRATQLAHTGAEAPVPARQRTSRKPRRGGATVNCRATADQGPRRQAVRDWATVLAAMEINAALGRGRYRDGRDVAASARTLSGFGLDVGTLGAVTTAADLLAEAAVTARRIAHAAPVPVHRHGDVVAYPLGAVVPTDLDVDDIIAADHAAATPGTAAGNQRVLHIQQAGDGARRFLLDTVDGPLSWPDDHAGTGWRVTAWRPVPHRRHPWQGR